MEATRDKEKAEKYFAGGKWEKALRLFLRAGETAPQDLRLKLRVAETLLRLARTAEAQMLFRQVADLYTRDGQLHKAVAVSQRLLEIDRDDRDAQAKLAALYERQNTSGMRDLPMAPDDIHRTVTEACRDDDVQKRREYAERLRQATTRKDFPLALELALKLWRLSPAELEPRYEIGKILALMNRKREAFELYFNVAAQILRSGRPLRAAYLQALIEEEILPQKRFELQKRCAILFGRAGGQAMTHDRPEGLLSRFGGRKEAMEEMLEDALSEPIDLAKIRPAPILSDLPRQECEALLSSLKPRTYAKGEEIFSRNATADGFFWMAHGEVGLFSEDNAVAALRGTPKFLVGETALLGFFSFLFDGRRRYTAIAHDEVELLELPRKDFERLTLQFGALRDAFDRAYRQRILPILLATNPVFSALPPDAQQNFAEKFKTERFREGAFHLPEGKPTEKLAFIREGVVDLYQGKYFERQILHSLGPGHFFADVEALTGSLASFTFRAAAPLTLLTLAVPELAVAEREALAQPEALREFIKNRSLATLERSAVITETLANKVEIS